MSQLTDKSILELLPHRPPFLFLDRVIDFKPGESLTAVKRYTINEYFFAGHFPAAANRPAKPIVPGVLLVESLAQAAGILAASLTASANEGSAIFFLTRISDIKFKKPVFPGDQLKVVVTLIRSFETAVKVMVAGEVDQEIVVEGELILSETKAKEGV